MIDTLLVEWFKEIERNQEKIPIGDQGVGDCIILNLRILEVEGDRIVEADGSVS